MLQLPNSNVPSCPLSAPVGLLPQSQRLQPMNLVFFAALDSAWVCWID